MTTSLDELLTKIEALNNAHRLRILAVLGEGREYVSELARRLGISRPLLYMHLGKLEEAGLVGSEMEVSEAGKAMKYYHVEAFELSLDPRTIADAVGEVDPEGGG